MIVVGLQVHSDTPCEDVQLVEHLKELMEELGPYIEREEPDQGTGELEIDSEEEEDDEEGDRKVEADDTMDTS